jgi:hypothetical protein
MKCIPLDAGDVKFATLNVNVSSNKAKESDEKNLEWAKKVWRIHQAGKDSELPWKGMELTTEVARARRIVDMSTHPDFHSIPLWGIAIGKSIAFGAFPGEPFNDIGKEIKRKSPFELTMLMSLSNGSRGYFPFSDAYITGGYESATSPFGPSVAENLIVGKLELLTKLYNH